MGNPDASEFIIEDNAGIWNSGSYKFFFTTVSIGYACILKIFVFLRVFFPSNFQRKMPDMYFRNFQMLFNSYVLYYSFPWPLVFGARLNTLSNYSPLQLKVYKLKILYFHDLSPKFTISLQHMLSTNT